MYTNFFMRSPGGENESNNISANNTKKESLDPSADIEKGEEKKSLIDKVHDALQEWSNDDQRDQEIDDTRP